MRSLALTLLAVVSLLALAPVAAAQPAPTATPSYTLTLTVGAGEFPPLQADGSVSVPFQVVLALSNVVCTSAVQVPVTITASAAGAPTGFAVLPEPNVINITISEGPHGNAPVGSPGGGTGDGVIRAMQTGNISANASVTVTVTADAPAPAGPPQGCQGAGAIGSATSEPATVFANLTETPRPPEPEPTPEDTPGFTLVFAAAAAGVALVLRRRRA